jgi:hypothetical protein
VKGIRITAAVFSGAVALFWTTFTLVFSFPPFGSGGTPAGLVIEVLLMGGLSVLLWRVFRNRLRAVRATSRLAAD